MNLKTTAVILLAMGLSLPALAEDKATVKGEAKAEAEGGFFSRTMSNIRGVFAGDEAPADEGKEAEAKEKAADAKAEGQAKAEAARDKSKENMKAASEKAADKKTEMKSEGKAAAGETEAAAGEAGQDMGETGDNAASSSVDVKTDARVKIGK